MQRFTRHFSADAVAKMMDDQILVIQHAGQAMSRYFVFALQSLYILTGKLVVPSMSSYEQRSSFIYLLQVGVCFSFWL